MKYANMLLLWLALFTSCGEKKFKTGWYYVADYKTGKRLPLDKYPGPFYYYLDPKPIVAGKHITRLELYHDTLYNDMRNPCFVAYMDKEGTAALKEATKPPFSKEIALVINNRLLSIAKIGGQVTTGVMFVYFDRYTMEELEVFKQEIAAGK